MKAIKHIAQALLTAAALTSLVLALSYPSFFPTIALFAAAYLSVKGLDKLGTFKEA